MTEISRDMLQRLGGSGPSNGSLERVLRTVRGSIITTAARGQRWWREEVFDVANGRDAVTIENVGAVLEELFRAFPDTTVRYIYEGDGRLMRRILEVDWS